MNAAPPGVVPRIAPEELAAHLELKLRPWQQRALRQLRAWQAPRGVVVAAPGTGKTILALAYAAESVLVRGGRVLWLVLWPKLSLQAQREFERLMPEGLGIRVSSYTGEAQDLSGQIVFASARALANRSELPHFDLLVADEAHHMPTLSYQQVTRVVAPKRVLGLTATPRRLDRAKLGLEEHRPLFQYGFVEAVRERSIATPHIERLNTGLSFEPSVDEDSEELDFSTHALSRLNSVPRNRKVVELFKPYAARGRALVFCVDVSHAESLAQTFREAGLAAQSVDCRQTDKHNKQVIEDFRSGRLPIVTSCEMLIEGADFPDCATVVMARPTLSFNYFCQMVGRGARRVPGRKESFTVIDLVDNWGTFGFEWGSEQFENELRESKLSDTERARRRRLVGHACPHDRRFADAAIQALGQPQWERLVSADPHDVEGLYRFKPGADGIAPPGAILVLRGEKPLVEAALQALRAGRDAVEAAERHLARAEIPLEGWSDVAQAIGGAELEFIPYAPDARKPLPPRPLRRLSFGCDGNDAELWVSSELGDRLLELEPTLKEMKAFSLEQAERLRRKLSVGLPPAVWALFLRALLQGRRSFHTERETFSEQPDAAGFLRCALRFPGLHGDEAAFTLGAKAAPQFNRAIAELRKRAHLPAGQFFAEVQAMHPKLKLEIDAYAWTSLAYGVAEQRL